MESKLEAFDRSTLIRSSCIHVMPCKADKICAGREFHQLAICFCDAETKGYLECSTLRHAPASECDGKVCMYNTVPCLSGLSRTVLEAISDLMGVRTYSSIQTFAGDENTGALIKCDKINVSLASLIKYCATRSHGVEAVDGVGIEL